jgi:serine/threonine-protein phosphatase 2A activator
MSTQSRPLLPALPHITKLYLSTLEPPIQHIRTDADVDAWRTTSGYATFRLFIARLSEASVGQPIPDSDVGVTKDMDSVSSTLVSVLSEMLELKVNVVN